MTDTVKVILAEELSAYCHFSTGTDDKTGDAVDDTQNLKLPYIIAAQAQKHVTHNEALRMLDAIVQLAVLNRDLTTPPASPAEGDRHIVAAGATGAWTGKDDKIAAWQDGAWAFYSPIEGWLAWIGDESLLSVWDGATWTVASSGSSGGTNPVPLVGVNATADTTNRLSINSPASLFNHEGSGHQQKINKAAVGDTASQLYQTNFSGRAEIGLTGDDNFHFKVSPDGTTFHESIVIDNDDGRVTFPNSPVATNLFFNLLEDAGRFGGTPEDQGVSVGSYVAPNYLSAFNGATFSEGEKFIHNNTTYGGTAGALGAEVDALIQKLKAGSATLYKRYGPEFFLLDITAGAGTSSPMTIGATTYYRCMTNISVPIWPKSTFFFNVKCTSGQAAIKLKADSSNYIDGVLQADHKELLPADGWVQVGVVLDYDPLNFIGYDNDLFRLLTTPSSTVSLALPCLFPGTQQPAPTPIGAISSLTGWR